nr:FecR domain-containing protein [Acidobacteriota bacterium]
MLCPLLAPKLLAALRRGLPALAALALAGPVFGQGLPSYERSDQSSYQNSFDIPAHVSRVEGTVVLERDDADAELERNVTLSEGDRVRTARGRVEILFADGTLLHLDRDTIIDFQRAGFVRVMAGRVRVSVPRGARAALRLDAPAATLELDPGGEYRINVAPNGDAELAVLR